MSNVVDFGKEPPVVTFLRQRLQEAKRGEIDGLVMLWERADGSSCDGVSGAFAGEYEIKGRLLDWAVQFKRQDDDE